MSQSAVIEATEVEVKVEAPKPGPVKKAPAKPVAKKAPAKAPAKKPVAKKAPAKKPVAKKAPAKKRVPAGDPSKPSWEASAKMGKGRAHTFRLKTAEIAKNSGYKNDSEAPFDKVVRFRKGNVLVVVTYTEQDFVNTVTVGDRVVIKRDEKDKWKRLNALLTRLAAAAKTPAPAKTTAPKPGPAKVTATKA
jgi:hypothetical protein